MINQNIEQLYQDLQHQINACRIQNKQGSKIDWPLNLREQVLTLHKDHNQSLSLICKVLNLPTTTVYNWIYEKPQKKYYKLKSKFKEVKLTNTNLSTRLNVDNSEMSLKFSKNGFNFEVTNITAADLTKVLGL